MLDHHVSACVEGANVELSHVNNTAVVNVTSEMTIYRDSLRELTLPSFVACNKRSVITFMWDINVCFELRRVQENLELPLVLRAINL